MALLTKEDLYVGKLVYRLQIVNTMKSRKKLTMVDANGVEWHRYDKEDWTYNILPMNICGSIKQIVHGVVDKDHITEDAYFLREVDKLSDDYIDVHQSSELLEDSPYRLISFFSSAKDAEAAGIKLCGERV